MAIVSSFTKIAGSNLIFTRGSKYPSYGGKKLPSFILPKQKNKTSHLKQALKVNLDIIKIADEVL